MFFHLLRQVFARFGIGQTEAILVNQHFLVLQPLPPGFFGYVVKYSLSEFPGIGGEIQAFGFPSEFDALHHSWHFHAPQKWASYGFVDAQEMPVSSPIGQRLCMWCSKPLAVAGS